MGGRVAVPLLFAALLLAGCAVQPFGAQKGRWEIEVALGGITEDGGHADLRGAVDLAIAQLNAADHGIRITLLLENAPRGTDARAALDALQKRGADAVLDLRGPHNATTLADHAASKKMLLVLPAHVNLTPGARGGYVVGFTPAVQQEAAALQRLASREGAERVVIVSVQDSYGTALSQALGARLGAAAVANGTFARDAAQQAVGAGREACAADPDAVLILAYPQDALRVLEGMRTAGCRDSAKPLASHTAFHLGLVLDPADQGLAAGLQGVMPATARPTVFRSLYEAMYQQSPGPFGAAAFDAVDYLALAAFDSLGGPGKVEQRVTGNVTTENLRSKLLTVIEGGGTRYQDLAAAVNSAKAGDDIDWQGLAHDLELDEGGRPVEGAWASWRTGTDGRSVMQGSV